MSLMRKWLPFAIGFVLALPASAQRPSSVSAGTVARPHAPTGIIGPRVDGHFHRGNRFGNAAFYPYGYYDDFYRYPEPVEQPAPVVVIREEKPVAAAPQVQPAPPPDPKIVEVPESIVRFAKGSAQTAAAIFILNDGRRVESQNYTITDKLLTIKASHQAVQQIPLDQVNVEATLAANRDRGLDLQLPENKSEILISF